MPAWARELLAAKLDAHARRYAAGADLVRSTPVGPGHAWNKGAAIGLGQWRARKTD